MIENMVLYIIISISFLLPSVKLKKEVFCWTSKLFFCMNWKQTVTIKSSEDSFEEDP